MRIVFMGTPDFAVPCLAALVREQYEVVGVYTQPDKPKGRGHRLQPPPVKRYAMEQGIPVFQPETFKEEAALETLRALKPDVILVTAYGKLLPGAVLALPEHGCINVHASLLPKYRGAGPIQWSVLNGEKETGVTTMYMAEGLDTGDMLLCAKTEIGENETAPELYGRLADLGAKLLTDTLKALASGTLTRTPQDDSLSSYAPMLSKELSVIDFSKSAGEVHNQVRGLSEWPCAMTTIAGKRLKVYRSEQTGSVAGAPGELVDAKRFVVACGDGGGVCLTEVQYEGAKRMSGEDFLRGRRLEAGTMLGK